MKEKSPLIFDITKGSFIDGPGVRTVIFFKGCPLSCVWCHNPESHSKEKEYFFYPDQCINCGNCKTGKDCFTLAKKEIGIYYKPEELFNIIMEDQIFYQTSNGGVTFSGGEPLIFDSYLAEILPRLYENKINIAFQTSGYFDFNICEKSVFPYTDLIYFDFKLMDDKLHIKFTGKSNKVILENFDRLIKKNIIVIPRITLIKDITATEDNLNLLADFFIKHGIDKIDKCEFLNYNPSCIDKLTALGKYIPDILPLKPLTNDEQEKYIETFKKRYNDLSIKSIV